MVPQSAPLSRDEVREPGKTYKESVKANNSPFEGIMGRAFSGTPIIHRNVYAQQEKPSHSFWLFFTLKQLNSLS